MRPRTPPLPVRRPGVVAATLLLAVVAATALAALPAPAAARLKITTKAYDVRISGSHVVRWGYADRLDRPTCAGWSVGKGTLEVEFATKKRARWELQRIERSGKKDEYRWGAVKDRLPTFEIAQSGEWQYNDPMRAECTPCGPLSEYGPCKPDPPTPPTPPCPKRRVAGVVDLTYHRSPGDVPDFGDELQLGLGPQMLAEVRYVDDEKRAWACLPGERGKALPLRQLSPIAIPVLNLDRIKRGKTRTYDHHRAVYSAEGKESDACGPIAGVVGMNACARSKVELQVRRVR